jgi:hypothetical protein
MDDNLFDLHIQQAKRQAEALGATLTSGKDAFAYSKGRRIPKDPERSRLMDGDTFTIPTDETSDQWLAYPISEGGEPTNRLLANVNRGGNILPIEIFVGTLLKSVTKTDGQIARTTTILKDGRNLADVALGCVDSSDVWRLVFGKTFSVSNAMEVEVRSLRNGQPSTRHTYTYTLTEI